MLPERGSKGIYTQEYVKENSRVPSSITSCGKSSVNKSWTLTLALSVANASIVSGGLFRSLGVSSDHEERDRRLSLVRRSVVTVTVEPIKSIHLSIDPWEGCCVRNPMKARKTNEVRRSCCPLASTPRCPALSVEQRRSFHGVGGAQGMGEVAPTDGVHRAQVQMIE